MDRKLIFLDIDGTLTEGGSNTPPVSAQRAVKEAREKGHLVYICTGRNYAMLRPLLAYGFDGVVGSAGGYILCRDQVIYDCPMTRGQQDRALKVLRKNGVQTNKKKTAYSARWKAGTALIPTMDLRNFWPRRLGRTATANSCAGGSILRNR